MSQTSPETERAIARIRAALTDTNPDMDFRGFDPIADLKYLLDAYDCLRGHAQTPADGCPIGITSPGLCSAGCCQRCSDWRDGWNAALSVSSTVRPVGMGWEVSEETRRHIDEIERNIREAPQNIARLPAFE